MELDKNYIKNNIISLGRKYDTRQVFEDFVTCCAYSLANAASYNQERENEYLRIAKKYEKEEFNSFAKMFAALQIELGKDDFDDVLGNLYEDLGLSSKHLGQFFTPIHISDLMAKITFNAEDTKKEIEKDGYTSMYDPCCGSGRMLLSYFKACKENGIDIDKVYFDGGDLSKLCSCMTYVNLSLLGASAIVYNQDTLQMKVYDSYITPALVYNKDLAEKLVEKGVLKRKDDYKDNQGELVNEQ